ncbi:hypothetical protein CBF23_003960 [Marinomonas agarivorans]|nr:hypothetical protein CBF23_003960 [Marinomonas agarivorans]
MKNTVQKIVAASLFGAVLAGCSTTYAHGHKTAFTWVDTNKGAVLANKEGMTLYTFDKDTKGVSNCYGSCATLWPPAVAQESDKNVKKYTKVKRKDGSYQWAYDGKPLYTWVNDTKSGDVNGDGVKGVWHIVTKENSTASKAKGKYDY